MPHRPLKLLYVPRLGDAPVDRQVLASVNGAAHALASLGIEVRDARALPVDLSPIVEFWPVLGQVGAAAVLAQHPAKFHLAGENMRAMAEEGRKVPATRYLAGMEAVDAFRCSVSEAFEHLDLVMTPTAAALPWPAEEPYPRSIDGRAVGPRGHAVYTAWVNACGHPAINLPCAPSPSGLPIGFQLVGRFGADELLLQIARRFEEANPWRERWPELAVGAGRHGATA
jgi:aspartyl-tRNA(Asn)/glutamyl-tRNA(Gln) amidotransferase subunit A